MRWSAVSLPKYLTHKLSTTREKKIYFVECFQSEGVSSNGGVDKLDKVYLEPIIRNAAGLFQSWRAFADLQVHPSLGCELAEVVLSDDLFRKYVQADLHILISCHRGIVIECLNIQSEETGTEDGDGAVKKVLSCCQDGAVGCGVARELQFVTVNGDTDTMCFGLVGPDADNKS